MADPLARVELTASRAAAIEYFWQIARINSCELHLVTGTGPWERPGDTYHFSHLLALKGIRHSLDDWGPRGGHDWPYWKQQMREYLGYL